jgi:hypothetical protein
VLSVGVKQNAPIHGHHHVGKIIFCPVLRAVIFLLRAVSAGMSFLAYQVWKKHYNWRVLGVGVPPPPPLLLLFGVTTSYVAGRMLRLAVPALGCSGFVICLRTFPAVMVMATLKKKKTILGAACSEPRRPR